MDDFFSDNFFGASSDSGSNRWSERDWVVYIRRSEAEIDKISRLYDENRKAGMSLEDIASMGGWDISCYNSDALFSEISAPEFSKEPLTLINHPVYIVSRALIKSLEGRLETLVLEAECSAKTVWSISKAVHKTSTLITVAVNSTDLGEDMFAHSYYKSAIFCMNSVLAEIEKFDTHSSPRLDRVKDAAVTLVFDLRQMCLNLS